MKVAQLKSWHMVILTWYIDPYTGQTLDKVLVHIPESIHIPEWMDILQDELPTV